MLRPMFLRSLLEQDFRDRKGEWETLPIFNLSEPIPDHAFGKLQDLQLSTPGNYQRPELAELEFQFIRSSVSKTPPLHFREFLESDFPIKERLLVDPKVVRSAAVKVLPFLQQISLPPNLCICGGTAEKILSLAIELARSQPQPQLQEPQPKKRKTQAKTAKVVQDVDLFFVGFDNVIDAEKVLADFARSLVDVAMQHRVIYYGDEQVLWHTGNVVNLDLGRLGKFQFILRLYKSMAEVLNGFDFGACQFGFDGKNLFTTRLGLHARLTRYNLVDSQRRSSTLEYRLRKYEARGYGLILPTVLTSASDKELVSKPAQFVAKKFDESEDEPIPGNVWIFDSCKTKAIFPITPSTDYEAEDIAEHLLWSVAATALTANSRKFRIRMILASISEKGTAEFSPQQVFSKLCSYAHLDKPGAPQFYIEADFVWSNPTDDYKYLTNRHFLTTFEQANDLMTRIAAVFGPASHTLRDGVCTLLPVLEKNGGELNNGFFERYATCCRKVQEYLNSLERPRDFFRPLNWIVENPASQILHSSSYNPCFSTFDEYSKKQ